jgi:hypothetical protein
MAKQERTAPDKQTILTKLNYPQAWFLCAEKETPGFSPGRMSLFFKKFFF